MDDGIQAEELLGSVEDRDQPEPKEPEDDIYELFLKKKPKCDPQALELIMSLAKKCSDLEKKYNQLEKASGEKNIGLFELINHQGGEICKKDEKIAKLEDDLARKEALIRNMIGPRSVVVQNKDKSLEKTSTTQDAPSQNNHFKTREEETRLGTAGSSVEIRKATKKTEEVEQQTTRGRRSKQEAGKPGESEPIKVQIVVPVKKEPDGERSLKRKRKSDQNTSPSENKENDEAATLRKSPRGHKRTPVASPVKRRENIDDVPPSLSKIKRQPVNRYLEDDDVQPPVLTPEPVADPEEMAAILSDEFIFYNCADSTVYSSTTQQPLSLREKELALERSLLLLDIHKNITAISAAVYLDGWASASSPALIEISAALGRLRDAGLLKEKREVFKKLRTSTDMAAFERALALRGLYLDEYQAIF